MKRTNKKKYSIVLFTLILALGVIAGAYALLNDTVILNANATIKEADSASLEIISATCDAIGTTGCGVDGEKNVIWTISEDKKSATLSLSNLTVDENGVINGWDIAEDQYGNPNDGIKDFILSENTITIKNTGKVPVQISYVTSTNGLNFETNIANLEDITGEILAPNATCTFSVDCDSIEETYTAGSTISATFTITGTPYTGDEEARTSHEHGRAGGI